MEYIIKNLNPEINNLFPKMKLQNTKIKLNKIGLLDSKKVYKCIISDGVSTHHLFAKLINSSNCNEIECLRTLWKYGYAKSDNYRIPLPLSCLGKENIILTEYIEGSNLNSDIYKEIIYIIKDLTSDNKNELIRDIANWLIKYESIVFFGNKADVVTFSSQILSNIDKIKVIDSKLKSNIKDFVNAFQARNSKIPVHLINDGFHSKNMIRTKDGLVVVDWGCSYEAPIFSMLSGFLRKLEQKARHLYFSDSEIDIFLKDLVIAYHRKTIFRKNFSAFKFVYLWTLIDSLAHAGIFRSVRGKEKKRLTNIFISRIDKLINNEL